MAGSPCPIEVMRRVVEKMHMRQVTIAYGMTETSPVSFQSSVDDTLERRVSTVGRVQPHLEVKIVDADGRIVPRGHTGELLTRGYSVMLGYWGDEARTREAIDAARWMHTGDLATIDDQGYCNIVGRVKDMVIRGGENIYPREIEEFLYQHAKVQDVQCIGVPDAKYGEELCACIILREGEQATEQEIRDFCDRQDRAIQDSALRALHDELSDDGYRQGCQIPAARADLPRAGRERNRGGMMANVGSNVTAGFTNLSPRVDRVAPRLLLLPAVAFLSSVAAVGCASTIVLDRAVMAYDTTTAAAAHSRATSRIMTNRPQPLVEGHFRNE